MCRHLAYFGPEIRLHDLLIAPTYSLLRQAVGPLITRERHLYGDGFGFGWYADDDTAVVYRRGDPIWQDPNLANLAQNLYADLWMAAIRYAQPGTAADVVNAQPLAFGDLLFSHDGFIGAFRPTIRRKIVDLIEPEVEAEIQGSTDSEYLFALIRQYLLDDATIHLEDAVSEAFATLRQWLPEESAQLNLLLTDGERLIATRHAINASCPPLHYTLDDEAFPDDAVIIASEPLNEPDRWVSIPQDHILVVVADAPPELIKIETDE